MKTYRDPLKNQEAPKREKVTLAAPKKETKSTEERKHALQLRASGIEVKSKGTENGGWNKVIGNRKTKKKAEMRIRPESIVSFSKGNPS